MPPAPRCDASACSFRQGDRLTVLNADDDNWLWSIHRAAGSDREGFIPRSAVEEVSLEANERAAAALCQLPSSFHRSKWIHGKIDRTSPGRSCARIGQALLIPAEPMLRAHAVPRLAACVAGSQVQRPI